LIYIAIGYFIVTYVYTVCWSTLGERMTRQIRIHYLAAVLEQEIAYFETVGSGEVSNRITGDTQTIQNGTSEKVGLCLQSASYFIAAFIVGFVKDAKLTGIMFSVVPAIFIVITGSSHYIAKNTEKASSSQSDASTFSQDALTNIRVSQAFSLQERLGKALNEFLEKAFKYGCRKALWAALMLGSIFWVAYSANALAFWEGGRIILSEQAGNVGAGKLHHIKRMYL
jgi:ATP-binding cassette subfamily B (MDR/TAP) protein 1